MQSSLQAIEGFEKADPSGKLDALSLAINHLSGSAAVAVGEEMLGSCKPMTNHIEELTEKLEDIQEAISEAYLDLFMLRTQFLLLRDPELEDRVLETLSQFGC
eukprot:Selendium_serpulae@DN2037_c0_g1_i1.p3